MMNSNIWTNFAVKDVEQTSPFYTALGFKANSEHNSEMLTSYFFGNNKRATNVLPVL